MLVQQVHGSFPNRIDNLRWKANSFFPGMYFICREKDLPVNGLFQSRRHDGQAHKKEKKGRRHYGSWDLQLRRMLFSWEA